MNGLTFSFESAWRFLFICQYTGYAENVITTPMITKNKLHTLLGKFIHNLRGKAYVLGIWTTSLIWMDKTCWWHFSAIGSDAYPPIMLLSIPPSLPPSLPPYLIYACVYNLRFCFYCYTIDVGWCQCFFFFSLFCFILTLLSTLKPTQPSPHVRSNVLNYFQGWNDCLSPSCNFHICAFAVGK